MITYTVSSNQLATRDIYEIAPVSSLTEFLTPRRSLCIVKTPYVGNICEMFRVMGRTRSGERKTIYLGLADEGDQGYLKSKLDRTLQSSFLFIVWKAKGHHTFRLVEERKNIAEFPDFRSALDAYFPDGFIPETCYRRNRPIIALAFLAAARRRHLEKISALLRMRINYMTAGAQGTS